MKVNGNLTLPSLGQGQVENVILDRVSELPSIQASEKGRIVFLLSDAQYYYNTGTAWQPFATGGSTGEITAQIGSLSNLTTTDKSNIVAAINEVDAQVVALDSSTTTKFFELDADTSWHEAIVDYVTVADELANYVTGATMLTRTVAQGDKLYVRDAGKFYTVPASGAPEESGVPAFGITNVFARYSNNQGSSGNFIVLRESGDFVGSFWSRVSSDDANSIFYRGFNESMSVAGKLDEIGLLNDLTTSNSDSIVGAINSLVTDKQDVNTRLTYISDTTLAENQLFFADNAGGLVVDAGAGARSRLGVAIGTDVQAFDADLATIAAMQPVVGDMIVVTGTTEGSRFAVKSGSDLRDYIGLGDIATHDDAEYVRVDGTNAMIADLNANGHQVVNLASPANAGDAATKGYVDNIAAGITWKAPVDAVIVTSTDVAGLDTEFASATEGFRALDLTNKLGTNSVYVKTATGWDAVAPVDGTAVFHRPDETGYVFSGSTWVQFTGGGQLTAGTGLEKIGNVLNVNLGAGIVELPTDGVGIDLYDAATSALVLTNDGSARASDSSARLHLLLDQTATGKLTQSAAGLKVSAGGITGTELAASVAGDGLTGGNGAALAVGAATPVAGTLGEIQVSADGIGVVLGTTSTTAAAGDHGHTIAQITDLQTTLDSMADATAAVQTEVDAVETAVGLNTDGTLGSFTHAIVSSSTTVKGAIEAVATKIAANATALANGYLEYTSSAAATTHTITHNRGIKYWNVTVIDDTDEVVIPQSIRFVNSNTLEVTFNVAINCTVIANGRPYSV